MKISAINITNNNQVSHKAVNQKLLKQAIDKYNRCAPYHNQLPLITSISNREIYGLLSTQDAIDTLEAIKPYAQNILNAIDDLINDLKKTLPTQ